MAINGTKTMTLTAASKVYGCTSRRLRKYILDGMLPAKKVGTDKYVLRADLERLFVPKES